jgi:CubicO group peptidase (beta-lactamase class C family)
MMLIGSRRVAVVGYLLGLRRAHEVAEARKSGKLFDGYGYRAWVDNTISPDAAWAVGWGGQRISWHKDSDRMVVVFSNVENWMADLYQLDREWGRVGR